MRNINAAKAQQEQSPKTPNSRIQRPSYVTPEPSRKRFKSAKPHTIEGQSIATSPLSGGRKQQEPREIIVLDDEENDSDEIQEIPMLPTPKNTPQKQPKTKAGMTPVKQRQFEDRKEERMTSVENSTDGLTLTLAQHWRFCAMWSNKKSLKEIAAGLEVGETALHKYIYELLKADIKQ